MIKVKELSKYYGDNAAVDNVSFEVSKGEILGFLGPNGAGKTTTMRMIAGYLAPSQGSITVGGLDVFEHELEIKKKIGYLPESPPLYPEMSVSSYLDFVGRIRLIPGKERRTAIDRVLQMCTLEDVRKRIIGNLSKGFRQRVGLAQALIHNPDLLILDEPTVGLDPQQIIEIRDLIKGFSGEHTVILSTHILQEVAVICGRILIINDGILVASDSLKDLASKTASRKISVTLKKRDEALIEQIGQLDGVESVSASGGLEEAYINVITSHGKKTKAA